MWTSADHVCHMFCLLINRCGPEDGTLRRLLAHQQSHRGGFCQLAVQFVEKLRKLRETPRAKHKCYSSVHLWRNRAESRYVRTQKPSSGLESVSVKNKHVVTMSKTQKYPVGLIKLDYTTLSALKNPNYMLRSRSVRPDSSN